MLNAGVVVYGGKIARGVKKQVKVIIFLNKQIT